MASCFKKQLILTKLQDVLKCLKRFNGGASDDFDIILSEIFDLQVTVGSFSHDLEVRHTIFDPFIKLLQLNSLASPYILCMLDAVQYFLINSVIDVQEMSSTTKIPEIVDSVVNLKFVQTDEATDEMVHLQAIHTLGTILNCKYGEVISKLTVLNILNYLFNTILIDSLHHSTMLRAITVNLFTDYIRNIVEKLRNHEQHDYIGCVPDVLTLIIDRMASETAALSEVRIEQDDRDAEKVHESAQDLGITDIVEPHSRPFILYLKLLIDIFNSLDNSNICFLFSRDPNLLYIIRESLGYSMLKLASAFVRSSTVLNLILSLHSTLYFLAGPCILLLNENIFRMIYVRGLQETSNLLKGKLLKSVVKIDPETFFCQDILETILDFLCSFISDSNFIPNLFVAFDSDVSKHNVCESICELIVDSGRLAYKLRIQDDGLETDHIMIGVIKCYQSMISSFQSCIGADSAVVDVTSTTRSRSNSKEFDDGSGIRGKATNIDVGSDKNRVSDSNSDNNRDIDDSCDALQPLLLLLKDRKDFIKIADKKFREKPDKCFFYLQEVGMLPTPLTSKAVASFLRNTPSLPKDKVGAYIGELGKDNVPDSDPNNTEFHNLVLREYASSFFLDDLNILDSLRVFLSAFRLPGEAQMIDRILVAFSEHCHQYCRESKSGIFEHSDVLYLLTFSIIMLNTDRHNQNIAQKNKMTMEQFIKNNSFYGREYHQTKPIPRELLEEIYNSISVYPLTTEDNAKVKLSKECWIDKQLQTKLSPHFGYTFMFGWPNQNFEQLLTTVDPSLEEQFAGATDGYSCESSFTDDSSYDLRGFSIKTLYLKSSNKNNASNKKCLILYLCKLLSKNITVSALDIISHLRQLLSKEKEKNVNVQVDVALTSFLYSTLFNAIQINSTINHFDLNDAIMLVLIDLCFSLNKVPVITPKISKLLWGSNFDLNSLNSSLFVAPDDAIECLLYSTCSRILMEVICKLVASSRHNFRKSWQFIWLLLCSLRDGGVLPESMVIESKGEDILSEPLRQAFDHEIYGYHTKIIEDQLQQKKKKSSSFLSLKSLLFGENEGVDAQHPPYSYEYSKWDVGYTSNVDIAGDDGNQLSHIASLRKFFSVLGLEDLVFDSRFLDEESLKNMISGMLNLMHPVKNDVSGADILNSPNDSLPNQSLPFSSNSNKMPSEPTTSDRQTSQSVQSASASLVHSGSESSLERPRAMSSAPYSSGAVSPTSPRDLHSVNSSNSISSVASGGGGSDSNPDNTNKRVLLMKSLEKVMLVSTQISASSKCWLENILAEIIIRNRERVGSLWTLIESHYSLSDEDIRVPTYTIERRVAGLFKIASRIIGRAQSTHDSINLLSNVFSKSLFGSIFQENSGKVALAGKSADLWFSRQYASSLWHLFTSNVSTLPGLSMEEWQSMFNLVGLCSSMGEFASVKAFEIMAFILHEPRLVAEVPVFCVSVIHPLVRSANSPLSVSTGAIKLLYHLHSRLEALVKHDTNVEVDREKDSSVLWENCWLPILKAISDGSHDDRLEVRNSAVEHLCAVMLDSHTTAVPTGLLISIIGEIAIPTFENYFVSYMPDVSNNNQELTSQPHEIKCLECLTLVLERNISRLLAHPTNFDKLWMTVLSFFGNVLSCRHISQDASTLAAYRQYFVDLFCLFDKSGIFKDKPDLASITHRSLRSE